MLKLRITHFIVHTALHDVCKILVITQSHCTASFTENGLFLDTIQFSTKITKLTAQSIHPFSFSFKLLDILVFSQKYHTSTILHIILHSKPSFTTYFKLNFTNWL